MSGDLEGVLWVFCGLAAEGPTPIGSGSPVEIRLFGSGSPIEIRLFGFRPEGDTSLPVCVRLMA